MKKFNLKEYTFLALLISLICIFGFAAYQMYYPVNPVRVDGLWLSTNDVKRGEVMYYKFVGEKFMDVTSHITLELVNGERMLIMMYDSNSPIGTTFKKRSFIVPYHIQPGRYQLVWTGKYEINAMRTITKTTRSEFITIR